MTETERPAWVDDELFPFQSRFVAIDGHTIHYIDEGSGPTLLFLHGNPTWSFVYRDVIDALRDQFRCIALDYPGFGLSSARPDHRHLPEDHIQVVTSFVDAMALSEVTLVAHDWGGPIGLATVAQRPAVFERLVLTNTWGWPTGDPKAHIASHVMGGPLGRLLIRQFNVFVEATIPLGHRLRKLTVEEMSHYRKALATPDRRNASAVLPRCITASRALLADVEASLSDLASLPTLIIWGNADVVFGDKDRRRWEQLFPDHHTVIVDGAGHFVQSDAPDRFAAAIRDWRGKDSS
ncbi:alpha/beta fold hydrolase [Nocardia altamirensis]|uniref:alpha/beta fold hydrolase n=1 Tax=Nocardia altamirensis TaxID=472158 RepID=UPI0008407E8D|nr:alpha/beta fold hydrolase [Nocardia altamirensis]